MAMASGGETAPKHETSMTLASDREIVIARWFDAPPAVVFDAWTRPELVAQWWAPASHCGPMARCEADVRPGGRYRYVLRPLGGGEIAFSGAYREVSPPSRLVYTQSFEQMPGDEVIITVTFEARDGGTRLESREVYPSAEVRAAVLASGMEHGMREAMDQLAALVAAAR